MSPERLNVPLPGRVGHEQRAQKRGTRAGVRPRRTRTPDTRHAHTQSPSLAEQTQCKQIPRAQPRCQGARGSALPVPRVPPAPPPRACHRRRPSPHAEWSLLHVPGGTFDAVDAAVPPEVPRSNGAAGDTIAYAVGCSACAFSSFGPDLTHAAYVHYASCPRMPPGTWFMYQC